MLPRVALPLLLVAGLAAIPAQGQVPAVPTPGAVDPTVPAARDTDHVVLTGKDLLAGSSVWSVPENVNAAVPGKDMQCFVEEQGIECGPDQYNHYQEADADTATATGDQV